MGDIKNIIFDLCGPIITIDVGLIDKRLQQFGVKIEQPYRKLYDIGLTKRFESNVITTAQFCKELRFVLETDISDEQICEAWNALVVDFKCEHQQLLPKVHSHYRTFMLSNSDEVNARYFEEYLNGKAGYNITGQCFNEIFFSYEIGDRKPSENVFKHILAKHSLNAAETVFIDDCEKHCIGANRIGINTIWLQKTTDVTELFNENGILKTQQI